MNSPLDHAKAAFRHPGPITPHVIEAAIIAATADIQAENIRLRAECETLRAAAAKSHWPLVTIHTHDGAKSDEEHDLLDKLSSLNAEYRRNLEHQAVS